MGGGGLSKGDARTRTVARGTRLALALVLALAAHAGLAQPAAPEARGESQRATIVRDDLPRRPSVPVGPAAASAR
jgi:hypothetical protein